LPYRLLFGDPVIVYLGYVVKEPQEFTFHSCVDTAAPKARALMAGDGKPQYGPVVGTFMINTCHIFANVKVRSLLLGLC
jgi:hypothetical protein